MALVGRVDESLVNQAVEVCAFWLARAEQEGAERLAKTVAAIEGRSGEKDGPEGGAHRVLLLGQFLSHYETRLRQDGTLTADILQVLQGRYFDFGTFARSRIIALHLLALEQRQFDATLLQTVDKFVQAVVMEPPTSMFDERSPMVEVLKRILPVAIAEGHPFFGDRWSGVLEAAVDGRWIATVAETVGELRQEDLAFIEWLLDQLWDDSVPSRMYRSCCCALRLAAVSHPLAVERLLLRSAGAIASSRLPAIGDTVKALYVAPLPLKTRVFEWFAPDCQKHRN